MIFGDLVYCEHIGSQPKEDAHIFSIQKEEEHKKRRQVLNEGIEKLTKTSSLHHLQASLLCVYRSGILSPQAKSLRN